MKKNIKKISHTFSFLAYLAIFSLCGNASQEVTENFTTGSGAMMIWVNQAGNSGQGYFMGQTEVTQKQWQTVIENNPSSLKGEELPVTNISWEDAMEYCRILTEQDRSSGILPVGYEYALPTAEQWRYIFRSNGSNQQVEAVAWHEGNSGGTPHPVAQKEANSLGFYDIHGNVSEWYLDSRMVGGQKLYRYGGSNWSTSLSNLSLVVTATAPSDFRIPHLGFRICAIRSDI